MKILYYLCIPFRTQNATASNQVVFSDGLHVMSLPEGICERVVIGSQARLRIWCLRAYGFESLRSHVIKRSRSVPRSLFLRLREEFRKMLRASRFRTPLSLRDISRGRTETSVAVSVARTFLEIEEYSPVSFKPSCGVISGNLSGRTPHSTDKLCVLLTLSGLKRFLTYKLLIVIVMSINNRFNPDIITHINFSREHPYRVSVLCFQVCNHP